MSNGNVSVLEAIRNNKKIQLGILAFLIALIMGFAAIYVQEGSYSEEGYLYSNQSITLGIGEGGSKGRLYLSYNMYSEKSTPAQIDIKDRQHKVINSIEIEPGENRSTELTKNAFLIETENFSDNIIYNYQMQYSYQPYGFLSIPALIFAIFGIIVVFRGFNQYLDSLKKEKRKSKSDKPSEKEKDIDFMGIEKKREEDEDREKE